MRNNSDFNIIKFTISELFLSIKIKALGIKLCVYLFKDIGILTKILVGLHCATKYSCFVKKKKFFCSVINKTNLTVELLVWNIHRNSIFINYLAHLNLFQQLNYV